MRRIGIIILLIVSVVGITSAQSNFYLSIGPGLPQGDYKNKLDGFGFGGTLGMNFAIQESPVGFGFSVGYLNTGLKTQEHDLSAKVMWGNTVVSTIPMYFKSTTSNNVIHTHLNLRITSPTEFIKIYGEGLLGFRYLYTSTRIEDITKEKDGYTSSYDYDENEINRKKHLSDFSFSYGLGAGVMIELTEGVSLDLRARHLWGSKAKYLNKDDIDEFNIEFTTENNVDLSANTNFPTRSSELDMLFIEVGLAFCF